jgi:hypothetical protein
MLHLPRLNNRFRQLVTHHDPSVANRANLGLQVLEKIRTTLMDPGKRASYDSATTENMGGLADPDIIPISPNPSPVPPLVVPLSAQSVPHRLPPTQVSGQPIWICPKCQSPNVVNSQFCKKCGETLASPCPTCNSLVQTNSQFCTNCGVNVAKARRKTELLDELEKCQSNLNLTTKNAPVLDFNLPVINNFVVLSAAWTIVSFITGLVYLYAILGQLPGLNLIGIVLAISGDTQFWTYSIKDFILSLVVFLIIVVITIILSILRKVSPFKGFGAAIAAILFLILPKTVQSTLIMSGLPESISTAIAASLTAFVYVILSLRMMSHVINGLKKLKPYNPWIPGLGCFRWIFTLLLIASPSLLGFYLFGLSFGEKEIINEVIRNYGFYLWMVNAIQLFFVAIILAIISLLSWRTSQNIETQYSNAVLQHSETLNRLTQEIQILGQAINAIDLRSL